MPLRRHLLYSGAAMKIINTNATNRFSTELRDVAYGAVVRRAYNGDSETFYLVVSPMDGTGSKALVTLASGVLKIVPQDMRVIEMDVTLFINGEK